MTNGGHPAGGKSPVTCLQQVRQSMPTVMYGLDRTMPGQAMCLGGANNGGGREGMRGQVRSDPR